METNLGLVGTHNIGIGPIRLCVAYVARSMGSRTSKDCCKTNTAEEGTQREFRLVAKSHCLLSRPVLPDRRLWLRSALTRRAMHAENVTAYLAR